VEAGVTVETRVDHRNDPVTRGRIANGVLTLTHTQNMESVYSLKNQLAKDVVLHLDHARHGGFTLVDPAKPDEEVLGQYRFRIELKTGAAIEHKVRETQPVSTTVALIQTPAETLRYYSTQRYLPDASRKFMAELAQTQGEINRLRQEEAELNQERARLNEDDARIRQNLGVLRADASELEMRRKYLTRLQDSDTRQEQIKGLLKEKAQQRAGLERDLAKKIQEYRED
jgi:DNA repair exonuclease SbcCD ATPase subunit